MYTKSTYRAVLKMLKVRVVVLDCSQIYITITFYFVAHNDSDSADKKEYIFTLQCEHMHCDGSHDFSMSN